MKVLVVGDFIYDKYNYGDTNRLSREASLPIFLTERTEHCFGGAANLALNCHQHAETTLCASLGPGPHPIRAPFELINIPSKTLTTIRERFILNEKHVFRADQERYEPINIDNIKTDGFDVVLISDYNQGLVDSPRKLIQGSRCPVIVNPRSSDWTKYAGAYCLTPNRNEFEQICGDVTVENARKAIAKYRLQAILVTLGADGVHWITGDEDIRIAATTEKAVDVNGAGDALNAVFACYFDPTRIKKTLNIAVTAAGIAAGKLGTYAVSKEDLKDYLLKNGETYHAGDETEDNNILEDSADDECKSQQEKSRMKDKGTDDSIGMTREPWGAERTETRNDHGKRVVFTNGCFDLIHISHLKFLQNARRLGDKLIVGLNSDESVAKIKRRPIHNQHRRQELLEGFSCVDEVIIFDEETPQNLLDKIRPDVYVKGSDYKVENMFGRGVVGKAIVIQSDLSVTTSGILEECHKRMIELDCKKSYLPEPYKAMLAS